MTLQRKLKIVSDGGGATEAAPAVQVAFASADRRHVDQHFGAAEGFVIYSLEPDRCELLEVTQFGRLDMDGNEDKLGAKIEALADCVAVYCLAVGASAVGQLKAKGIQPIKVTPNTPISSLLRGLQRELRDGPSVWLARAIDRRRPRAADRFEAMEMEGWSES
jgi:nitrogen fixation protein NifX